MVITELALTAAMENISHMLHMKSGYLQFTEAFSTSIYCGSLSGVFEFTILLFTGKGCARLGEIRVCSWNL